MSTDLATGIRHGPAAWPSRRLERPGLGAPAAPPHPAWEGGLERDRPGEPAEDRLARLASALGPLRRVMAALAERLVAKDAPARLGYARLGDYARERLGISARQVQELARVDRALPALPALERALVGNELPWSKVRLLARVVGAEDEAAWIARARALSTRRLEEEVRASTPRPDPHEIDQALPETTVRVWCAPAVCEKWALTREMAERVAGQRLRAGEVLEQVAAEVYSSISIAPAFVGLVDEARDRGPHDGVARPCAGEPPPASRAPARELPASVASLAVEVDAADAFELDRRLRLAVQLEQTVDAAIAPLLRCVVSPEYEWCGDSYRTLASYASDGLGISASKARALLRLERAGDVCPELRAAYRSGRLSWVKAQCLLPLLLLDIEGEWRPTWVAWAGRVTVRRLQADVERALVLRAGHPRAWRRCESHPERAQDPIPPGERQLCAPDLDPEATQELAWRVPVEVAGLFRAVLETLRARLRRTQGRPLSDGQAFDGLLDAALVAWTLRDPRARRTDPVIERDGYLCAVPGCTSRRNLHDHHVVFRSACGSDARENRITLCAFHHQRGLHAGLLRIRGRAPGDLVFELGVRPGAPPLLRYRSGDVAEQAA